MAITTVDSLRQHLQWAIEFEHCTLPPYLCALYSIKDGHNREAAEVIHSVFIEEMLHLTLAANLLNAVGGSPQLDTPRIIPSYPAYLPHSSRSFLIPLMKFSKEALEVFLQIERPSLVASPAEDDRFHTVGQFYEALEEGLVRLSNDLGERALFSGDPARQVTDRLYYGGSGRIIAVHDLKSALAALEEIVGQGEGLQHEKIWDGDRDMFHPERPQVAHYFRFNQLLLGRRYQPGDTPQSGPTGEPIPVEWDAVHDMRPNPRTSDCPDGSEIHEELEAFNHAYSSCLHLLHRSFNRSPRLLAVATGAMYGLKEHAVRLMTLPTGDGSTTVGPSFEYVPPAERHLSGGEERKVLIVRNGPYLVYGNVPLTQKRKVPSGDGHWLAWEKTAVLETEDTYALCRCGRSSAKPFCDGTHARSRWDGTESADTGLTADRVRVLPGSLTPESGVVHAGAGIVVKRDGSLCMGAGFCVGRIKRLGVLMADASDSDVRARIIGMIEHCPSGAFTYALEPGGPDVEPDFPAAIAVTAEHGEFGGPLWVTGGIPVVRSDGQPLETRNRVTLCRCGGSSTKPLCDGMHRQLEFREL